MENSVMISPFEVDEEISTLEYTIPYGVELINANKFWAKGYTGKNVVIAVIDTGCDTNHPALKGRIIGGRNFTNDDNGRTDIYEDYQGHGTHVCGTICANFERSGVSGVAPNAKILVLKALDKNGNGSVEGVVNAINHAIRNKVDIISMSLGSSKDDKQLKQAVKKAVNKNILVVCAAGNRGDNNKVKGARTIEQDYPGSYEESIVVGAIDSDKNIASFSNSNKYLDIVAPGVKILSTYKNGGYATLSGTSMATPHVAGALALLIEWSRKEFSRKLTEAEYYAQLIKCTKVLNMPRTLQGNGYVYLDTSIINKQSK